MPTSETAAEIAALKTLLAEKESEIAAIRDTDSLTKLPNRAKLETLLGGEGRSEGEVRSEGESRKLLLIADLKRFGMINAVYGTQIADFVIAQIAAMLRCNAPKNASIFRFSGDEFAYLFDDPLENQAESFAEQLLSFAEQSSIYYEAIEIRISFTIGAAYGNGGAQMITEATIALQEAKLIKGANRFTIYSQNMEILKRQQDNLYWIPRVRDAIESQSIETWYQPIVSNETGELTRYECLARLRDGFGNIADPYLFLEAAEISGILTAITKAMIVQSFTYFEGTTHKFSINITDGDLEDGYLEELLSFRIARHRLSASQIALEIVETVRNKSLNLHIDQVMRFKEMGFVIAADDFGAEHSNFMRLMAVDIDIIKIDGAFIRNIVSDHRSEMIVRNIVEFARTIGAKTVAEYVADRAIFEKVKSLGVDYSQGFYFGKPQPYPSVIAATEPAKASRNLVK
ncbi:hypothetical protein FACS189487_09490 [Campylobacterota bacterium]|nr:hypothetical protein FACS189487_09490 [Campylobacterota bacterium]